MFNKLSNALWLPIFDSISSPIYLVDALTNKIIKRNSIAKEYHSDGKATCLTSDGKAIQGCPFCTLPCVVREVKKKKEGILLNRTISFPLQGKRSMDIYGYPIYNRDGDVIKVIEHIVDVTSVEKVSNKSSLTYDSTLFDVAKLSSAVSSISPNLHLVADSYGEILSANPVATKMFGYSPEELKGKNVSILTPSFQYDEYSNYIDKHLAFKDTGKSEKRTVIRPPAECFAVKANGEIFQIMMYVKEVIISGECFFVGIIEDITKRKEATVKLAKWDESLAHAQKVAKLGNWEWDFIEDSLFWSDELYRIYDFKPQEFKPTFESFLNYASPSNKLKFRKAIMDAKSSRKSFNMINRILLPNGSVKIVEEKAEIVFDKSGEPEKMIGTVQDITAQKETEQLLIQEREKAESATILKDKFISLVSHDLIGPVSAMIGYTNLILNDEVSPPKPGVKEILEGTVATGRRLISLIDDLLSISRFKLGAVKPKSRFLNSRMLADIVVNLNIPRAKEKGIELKNLLSNKDTIFADQKLLEQVLINLITNAIKFCDKGDVITVFKPVGEVSTIAVQDTGRGINIKRIEEIFSYEVKTSTVGTQEEIGHGMGLPLCRDILEAHGGTLTVESVIGKGSTFYIKFPYSKPVVMVVDDQKNEQVLMKKYLEKLGAEPVGAMHGEEALDMINKEQPHLLITNMHMPIMNGLELITELRDREETKTLPIIMITADSRAEIRQQAFDMGANDFLQKGGGFVDFEERVSRFIGTYCL